MPKGYYTRTAEHLAALRTQIRAVNSRPMSQATREKMRASHLGKKYGPMSWETREKISLVQRGRPITEAHRRAISDGKCGRPLPEVHRKNISRALLERERILSTARRAQIVEMNRNRVVTVQTRERMRAAALRHAALDLPGCRCGKHYPSPPIYERTRLEARLEVLLREQGITDLIPQKSFWPYRVDFFSPSRATAYEADGAYWHNLPGRAERDAKRDALITSRFGIYVERFSEDDLKAVTTVKLGSH